MDSSILGEIVGEPSLVSAVLLPRSRGRLLVVYRSAFVRDEDHVLGPVRDVLTRQCHKFLSVGSVVDGAMILGRASLAEVFVFDVCPGATRTHECVRVEVPAPRRGDDPRGEGESCEHPLTVRPARSRSTSDAPTLTT